MPLINGDPADIQPKVEATGHAVSVEYSTPLVETRKQPLSSLLTRMEGSNFVVDWYGAVMGKDSQLVGLQTNRDPVYQQYAKTRRLETKLQGDLSFSQDEATKEKTITAELLMYPIPIPNQGNMCVADIGDGRKALFKVTSAVKATWMMLSVHRVTIQAVDEEGSPTWRTNIRDLEDKVVERNIFVKDYMLNNRVPLVLDEAYESYRELQRIQASMKLGYFRNFFSETIQSLILPNQLGIVYDPFLVRAVLALSAVEDSPLIRKVADMNVESDPAFTTTTVWDALLYVDSSHLHVACHRMAVRGSDVVMGRPAMGGLFASRVDKVIYPIDHRTDGDQDLWKSVYGSASKLGRSAAPVDDFQRLINTKDATEVPILDELPLTPIPRPNIHRVTDDEYYVFSKAFYHRDEVRQSKLESMVWTVLEQGDIEPQDLLTLVRESQTWDNLDRFYLIPVLMVLTTIVLRGPSVYGG